MVLRSFLAARRGVARRGTASAAAFLAVAAGAVVVAPADAGATVPSCSSAGIGVTPLHGPVFYTDAGNSPSLTSAYAGYSITDSTGAALNDTWVQLSSFTGDAVSLGTGQPAAEQIPALAAGTTRSLYWYLTSSAGSSASAQNHTVTVYSHQPGLVGATVLCATSGGFNSVQPTIGANANKITSVALSSATPSLGSTFAITVVGNTGTIGSGPTSPADPNALWMSPSATSGWPAAAYRLVGTRLNISSDGTAAAQNNDNVLHLQNLGTASRDYTATYTFQATGFTATNSTLVPVEQISSGNQVKHTGSYPSSIPAIAPASNDLAVSFAASPTRLPSSGGTVTYTGTLAGTTGASLDSMTLTIPGGASVVPGSAAYDGATLPDPVGDGSGHLVLQGPFTLTAGTDTVSVQLSYGAGTGEQQSSVVGNVGATIIDTTPNDLTDNSPATAGIRLNSAPVANPDSATVAVNSSSTTIPVLAGDTDADSDALAITAATQPAHGSVSWNSGTLQYTPAAGYSGTDTFTYTISDGLATATGNVTVTVSNSAATQTITFPQPPGATLLSSQTVSATSDSGLAVEFSSVTPSVCDVDPASGLVTLVSVGTCVIEADQAGDGSHSAATPVQRAFAVTKASQALTFPQPQDVTLASEQTTVSATADSELPVGYQSLTTSVCTVDASGTVSLLTTGACTIAATQSGDDTYAAAAGIDRSFAVTTAPQSITFAQPADMDLGTTEPLAASSTSGLAVVLSSDTGSVCTVSGSNVTAVGAGTCTLAADQAGDAAYSPASTQRRSFTVSPAPATQQAISFPAIADTALIESHATASASSDSGLPIDYSSPTPETCSVEPTSGIITLLATGTCTIEAGQAGDLSHAAATPVTRSFAITLTAQHISFPAPSDSALVDGTTTVAPSSDSGLAVTVTSLTTATCTADSSGTITLVATGDCTLEASQAGNAAYSAASAVDRTFAIVRSAQAITFPALPDAHVGDIVPLTASSGAELPITYSAGPPTVCVLDESGAALELLGAGTCAVDAEQPGTAAYLPADANRSFTVFANQTTQTISFPIIDDTAVTTTGIHAAATASSQLDVVYNSLTPAVCSVTTGGAVTLLATGTCTLQADQAGNDTYAAAPSVTSSFTVVRASQTITFAQPADAAVNAANVAVVATATSGLPIAFSSQAPSVCSVDGTGNIGIAAVGTCTVTAAQPGSATYAAAQPVTRSFAVTPLSQTITLSVPASEDVSIGSVPFTASSDAGLPVGVTAGPATVCVLAGARTVQLVNSGTCLVRAVADGDSTHRAALPVQATMAVTAQADDKTYTLPPVTGSPGSGGTLVVNVLAGNTSGQTLVAVTQPPHGQVAITSHGIVISLPRGYKGTETFTYTTEDGSGGRHTATVTLVVPNSAPTIKSGSTATIAGTGRSVVVAVADLNRDRLRVTVGRHAGARVTISHGHVRIVPSLSYSGRLSVPVTVSDGDGGVATAAISVLVSPRPTVSVTRSLRTLGTFVSWHRVPTTNARYRVTVNGRTACLTAASSCTVGRPLGPKANVRVTVIGRQRTVSTPTRAVPHRGVEVLAGSVYFGTDQATVSPWQRHRVRAIAHRLATEGFTGVHLVGYTDSRGSRSYNESLSRQRALAVATLLDTHTRIGTRSAWRGESKPAATNATERGQALNRRVEIWLTG